MMSQSSIVSQDNAMAFYKTYPPPIRPFSECFGFKKRTKKKKVNMGSRMMDPVRKIYIGGLPNNANKYDIEV